MTYVEATAPVLLGTAGNYAILAKTGISTVPASVITGDIAVSPITGDAMTGFLFGIDSGGEFATAEQVTGKAWAATYAAPTPSVLTIAISDMETAYLNAQSRENDNAARINLGGGILSAVTLTPGVYTFGTNVLLTGDVTFSGNANDVFIIQIAGNLVQAANYQVILNGVKAENIFWQVAGFANMGAGAHMEGIILAKTKVDFITGSSLNGRVLTQTACNLQKATITEKPETITSGSGNRRGLRSS
jgi:hypothetical protein